MDRKGLRAAVMGLHKACKKPLDIATTVKVSRKTVWRIIKRLNKTNTTDDRHRSGRPKTVNTSNLKAKLWARIKYNNQRSIRKLAKELEVNRETV